MANVELAGQAGQVAKSFRVVVVARALDNGSKWIFRDSSLSGVLESGNPPRGVGCWRNTIPA